MDHDHKSGAVRGVLCRNCNGIEGKIYNLANRAKRWRTVPEFIRSVLSYWEIHTDKGMDVVLHPMHKTDDEKRLLRNKKARLARVKAQAIKNVGK